MLDGAEQVLDRREVPQAVWRELDRTRSARLVHRLVRNASDPATGPHTIVGSVPGVLAPDTAGYCGSVPPACAGQG